MSQQSFRNSAGSVELKGGTGAVLHMVSLDHFLEAYKCDTTFRIQTPEIIDPQNTNPKAPWVVTQIDGIGASSMAVARVLLQGKEILENAIFDGDLDKSVVINQLHACKEQLVICEQVAVKLHAVVESVIAQVEASGVGRDNHGRALNPFPKVLNLEADVTAFLVHAKRALSEATALTGVILGLPVKGANFHVLAEQIAKALGSDTPVVKYIEAQAATAKYLVDLRNFQEHPGANRTIIEDFRVLPNGAILPPVLFLAGEEPKLLHEQLRAAVNYLVHLTEAVFIHSVMARLSNTIPFYIEEIEPLSIKAECPIKYQLSIDLAALTKRSSGS